MLYQYHNIDRSLFIDHYLLVNQHINLTAIRDADQFFSKHIVDSLTLIQIFQIQDGWKVCDVGTGGGFPLLPLAIVHSGVDFIGLDSVQKKLNTIQSIAEYHHIHNIHTVWSRAESHPCRYDLVTCRAVAYIDKLIPQIRHLVTDTGYIALYKLFSIQEEQDLIKITKNYQLRLMVKHYYTLNDQDTPRVLYLLQSQNLSYLRS